MTIEESQGQPEEAVQEEQDLKPKPPLPFQGIKTFTVCRQADETGVSGTGL